MQLNYEMSMSIFLSTTLIKIEKMRMIFFVFVFLFFLSKIVCFCPFQKICEKPQVINDYEAGRGIPNNVILGKIERVIGVKLRGKERGQPMAPPTKK